MPHELQPKPGGPSASDAHRSSRRKYHGFRKAYRERKLDEHTDATPDRKPAAETDAPAVDDASPEAKAKHKVKRREYLREYARWLKPYRFAIAAMFLLAITRAGLEMIEPLFMRFIVNNILLNTTLDRLAKLSRL